MGNIADYQSKHRPSAQHRGVAIIFIREKSPVELPRAHRPIILKGCVGTLKDGYVRNLPLPWVPQIQSASPTTSHESIACKTGVPLPGYLHNPSCIPTLPKLGSILGFSQRLLWPFSSLVAIKAKNNLLSFVLSSALMHAFKAVNNVAV